MTTLNTIIEEENTPDTEKSYQEKELAYQMKATGNRSQTDHTPDTEKCKHNVVGKYCFRCKRPDLACRCNCLNFYKIECNCPCHSQVEIEQNAETGEVLTANGIELIPQQRGGWEEDFELCFRYFFMDMADGAVKHDIKCFIRTALTETDRRTKADWLRSEIEKLEGVKRDLKCDELPECSKPHIHERDACYNTALTSIITRYKEELKVLESK